MQTRLVTVLPLLNAEYYNRHAVLDREDSMSRPVGHSRMHILIHLYMQQHLSNEPRFFSTFLLLCDIILDLPFDVAIVVPFNAANYYLKSMTMHTHVRSNKIKVNVNIVKNMYAYKIENYHKIINSEKYRMDSNKPLAPTRII